MVDRVAAAAGVLFPPSVSCNSAKIYPPRRALPVPETYETVQAPPATVFLHDPQFQIPTECRFTVFLPQNVQMYRACWVISIFLTCFRSDAPYLEETIQHRLPLTMRCHRQQR